MCGSDYGITLYRSNNEGILVGVTDAVSGTGSDADDLDGQIILLPETGGYQVVSATASGEPGDSRSEAFIEGGESGFLFTDSTNLGVVDGGGLVLTTTDYYDVTLVTDTDPGVSGGLSLPRPDNWSVSPHPRSTRICCSPWSPTA